MPEADRIPRRRLGRFGTVNPTVFGVSFVVVVAFVLYSVIWTGPASRLFGAAQDAVIDALGWGYILAVAVFLIFVLGVLISRYGTITLGDPGERPAYGTVSWIAMLFSAGMGIGLIFWSVAEPIFHYAAPPFGAAETAESAQLALRYTFFHWGLHAWATYIVIAMALAYFAYRRKLPLTTRSLLYPLIGDRIYGPIGHAVDVFAIFGTLFGVATSLGLGVLQINTGLNELVGLEIAPSTQLVLIAVVTAFATASVASGLDVGILRLSQLNILLSAVILAFVLAFGPTQFILANLVQATGDYLQNLPSMSFYTDALLDTGWQADWTMFYWGWWIAWSPFVGMFIARVSRGRSIREFIVGVLFVPTGATFVWLATFGGLALHTELMGVGGLVEAVQTDVALALYVALGQLPLSSIVAALATLLIVTYFVTSSDSGSLVIDIIAAGGSVQTARGTRVFWAVSEGLVAAALLLAGGLAALQTASIVAGLPFAVIMVFVCFGLGRALRQDPEMTGSSDADAVE